MSSYNVPYPHIFFSEDKKTIVKMVKNEEGKYVERRVADAIWIEEIYENLDERCITAQIGFDCLGEEKHLIAKREDYMNMQNIVKFQGEGLDVMHTNVKDVISHLRNEEYTAPKRYQHSKLGFDIYNKKTIFKHYKCLNSDIKSTYNGNFAIKPKGSKKAWLKLYSSEIQGHAPLELICIMALSSVIVGYIGGELGLDTIICHLTGNSTTGKSTAMKLAISMFGYPDVKENGLFTSYNSTVNALIKTLSGIKGVPVAFDEISMANIREFNNFVYKLANGVDKSGLNKNSELRPKNTWLTTILSNGEEPIIQPSSNTGLYNRVYEFDNVMWTKDSSNAENINRVILNNYGHIGINFVEYMLKQEKSVILEMYEDSKRKIRDIFNQRYVEDKYTDRRTKGHAVFLTTAVLFEQAFKMKLCIKEILDLLMEVEKSSIEKRNFDRTAIDYIYNFILINMDRFNIFRKPQETNSPIFAKNEYWGNIIISESNIELEINPLILENLLTRGGFKSIQVVLKEFKKCGFLDHEKDKLYRKRKNHLGKVSKVYVIVIKNEGEDERFNSINMLLDKIQDINKRKLLLKEKERMKQES